MPLKETVLSLTELLLSLTELLLSLTELFLSLKKLFLPLKETILSLKELILPRKELFLRTLHGLTVLLVLAGLRLKPSLHPFPMLSAFVLWNTHRAFHPLQYNIAVIAIERKHRGHHYLTKSAGGHGASIDATSRALRAQYNQKGRLTSRQRSSSAVIGATIASQSASGVSIQARNRVPPVMTSIGRRSYSYSYGGSVHSVRSG